MWMLWGRRKKSKQDKSVWEERCVYIGKHTARKITRVKDQRARFVKLTGAVTKRQNPRARGQRREHPESPRIVLASAKYSNTVESVTAKRRSAL
jgi:hypothetical protein